MIDAELNDTPRFEPAATDERPREVYLASCGCIGSKRRPSTAIAPNVWWLYQVHGNVEAWTGDCWNDRNSGNSDDGGLAQGSACTQRVVSGVPVQGIVMYPCMEPERPGTRQMCCSVRTHVLPNFAYAPNTWQSHLASIQRRPCPEMSRQAH